MLCMDSFHRKVHFSSLPQIQFEVWMFEQLDIAKAGTYLNKYWCNIFPTEATPTWTYEWSQQHCHVDVWTSIQRESVTCHDMHWRAAEWATHNHQAIVNFKSNWSSPGNTFWNPIHGENNIQLLHTILPGSGLRPTDIPTNVFNKWNQIQWTGYVASISWSQILFTWTRMHVA